MNGRRTPLAVAGSLAVLLLCAPRPTAALALLRQPSAAADPTAPVVALAALAAWAVTAWLAVAVLVVVAAHAPGLVGRAGQALARRVVPRAVRRAVEATLGLAVLTAPLAATHASAAPLPERPAGISLDWPGAPAAAQAPPSALSAARNDDASRYALDWPGAPARDGELAPRPDSTASAGPAPAPPAPAPDSRTVVVRRGDSLWRVAERALGPDASDREVAAAWPRWWAANREAVGDDPDLITPGTRLQPPPAAR